jgi:5-methylcytosine-specific restriction endonuclease McrA
MPVTWQHLYSSAHWQRLRKHQLREHPLCKFCLAGRGEVVPATIVDHVEPHHGDPNKFFLGELQSLCKPCHDSRKRLMEINGYAPDIGQDGWPIDPLHPANRVR